MPKSSTFTSFLKQNYNSTNHFSQFLSSLPFSDPSFQLAEFHSIRDFIETQKQTENVQESKLSKLLKKGLSGHDNKLRIAQDEKVREVIKANLSKEEIKEVWDHHMYL